MSISSTNMAQTDASTGVKADNGDEENKLPSKKTWYQSRKQIRLLSRIIEADEAQADNRNSRAEPSPV